MHCPRDALRGVVSVVLEGGRGGATPGANVCRSGGMGRSIVKPQPRSDSHGTKGFIVGDGPGGGESGLCCVGCRSRWLRPPRAAIGGGMQPEGGLSLACWISSRVGASVRELLLVAGASKQIGARDVALSSPRSYDTLRCRLDFGVDCGYAILVPSGLGFSVRSLHRAGSRTGITTAVYDDWRSARVVQDLSRTLCSGVGVSADCYGCEPWQRFGSPGKWEPTMWGRERVPFFPPVPASLCGLQIR